MQEERGVLTPSFSCVLWFVFLSCPVPSVVPPQRSLHILWKCLILGQTKQHVLSEQCVCILALLHNSNDGTARQNSSS